MKNYIIILIALSVVVPGKILAQQHSFTVSGNISGLDTEFMIRSYDDPTAPKGYRIDTITVKDGRFTYTGPIDEYSFVSIYPKVERTVKRLSGRSYIPAKSSQLMFIAYPGANIRFSGKITDFVDAYPSGNAANNDLARLHREIFPIMNRSANLYVENYHKPKDQQQALKDAIERLDKQVIDKKIAFVRDNPSSIAALAYLEDLMLRSQINDDEAIKYFDAIPSSLYGIAFYKKIAKRVAGIKSTKIGADVPAIVTSRTFNNNKFDLASLKGKYVVIDFWGTWCAPCVAELPELKEYYEAHQDKMEFVSVAQDKEVRWKKFLTKKEYYWHQILNGEDDEDFVLKFNVSGFPTKFVISPEGKILAKFVGTDERFYEFMDNALKGNL